MPDMSRFRGGLREFTVIVAGVLVALWIDAGWTWCQDRREESELRDDLASDFAQNAEQAEALQERYGAMYSRANWMLVNVGQPIPVDSVAPLALRLTRHLDYSRIRGAVDGAFRSGRVSVVRDAQVRASLAEWDAAIEDLRRELERVGITARQVGESWSTATIEAGGQSETDTEARARALNALQEDPRFRALLIDLVRDLESSRREVRGVAEISRRLADDLGRIVAEGGN